MCLIKDIEELPQDEEIEITYEKMSETDIFNMCYKTVVGIVEQFDKRARRYNPKNDTYADFLNYIQHYYPK